MDTTTITKLEDIKINVKFKLSAFWISLMCCFIYGDFFTLFVPGHIKSLMEGNSGAGPTTPLKLLMFAVMMTIPSLMIVLSLLIKAKINRLLNICFGIFYAAIMILVVATSLNNWMIFYTFLGIVEIVITFFIIRYAWKWPQTAVQSAA